MVLTPEMKEIALRVGAEVWPDTVRNIGDLEEFAERFLAAMPKPEPTSVTCQIYGHVVGACSECNTHAENDVNETNKVLADNYMKLTCGTNTKEIEQLVAEACAEWVRLICREAAQDISTALATYKESTNGAIRGSVASAG